MKLHVVVKHFAGGKLSGVWLKGRDGAAEYGLMYGEMHPTKVTELLTIYKAAGIRVEETCSTLEVEKSVFNPCERCKQLAARKTDLFSYSDSEDEQDKIGY